MPQAHIRKGHFHLEIVTFKWKGHIRLRGLCFDVGKHIHLVTTERVTFTWEKYTTTWESDAFKWDWHAFTLAKDAIILERNTFNVEAVNFHMGTASPHVGKDPWGTFVGGNDMHMGRKTIHLGIENAHIHSGRWHFGGSTHIILERVPFMWEAHPCNWERGHFHVESHTCTCQGAISLGSCTHPRLSLIHI